jgi:hypothetical protein
MSIIYQVEADLDVVVMEVERGEHPGLSIHHATEGAAALWPIAITDGTNYLWPEGSHLALTWGGNNGMSVLRRLGVAYSILD